MDFQANQTLNDSDSVLNISKLGQAFPPDGKPKQKNAGKSGKKEGKRRKDGVDPKLSLGSLNLEGEDKRETNAETSQEIFYSQLGKYLKRWFVLVFLLALGDLGSMSYSTIIMSTLFGIICLVGIIGNSLVICAVLKKSSPSSTVPDIFIVNLSLVDLLFLLGMPFLIHQLLGQGSWKFGGTMCTIITALDANSQFTSTYILTAMSIDRYLATVYPFSSTRFRKPPLAIMVICMLWGLSFLSITPVWMYAQLIPLPGELLGCGIRLPDPQWDIYWYTLYQFFLAFAMPFTLITVAYQRILLKMARSSEALTRQRGTQLRIKRVTRIAIAICLAFFLCWAPFHVLQLIQLAVEPTLPFYYAYNVAISLGYANSCLNPFIYIVLGQNSRRKITVSDQPADVEGLFQHHVKNAPGDPSESGQPLLHLVSVLAR